MNVLDEVSRRRYELNIMGRLSMSDDWRDSEVSSLGESHRFISRIVRLLKLRVIRDVQKPS